jgi:glycine oxidase
MVLFSGADKILSHIINVDSRYLVPRTDGRVLVGSTEEEAGFEKVTTNEGIKGLLAFANKLAPELLTLSVEMCWAGLRPATRDGLPYLGGVPGVDNAFVAAGHFRSGLWLSPATAVVMHELIAGRRPQVELAPFRLDRSLAGASG